MTADEQVSALADTAVRSALSALDVGKRYGAVTALDAVDLDVEAGEVHGIVGENGAGKSTLMGVVSGAVRPDSGSVSLAGVPLEPFTPERAGELGLAIVRQEPALLPDLTVAENLYLGVPGHIRPPVARVRSWSREILSRWDEGLVLDPTLRVEQLPPEQRFIVEICRAFAANPSVLVLDEPTEHLAADDVAILFGHIRRIVDDGASVVYISHRIAEVKQIADRLSVLRNGRGQGTFDVDELTEESIVRLIVGRELEAAFPAKPNRDLGAPVRFDVAGLSGPRFTDVSVSVRAGEILGLSGIEGNGQRDFLRAVGGIGPSRGRVVVDDRQVDVLTSTTAAAAGVAFVASDRHREGMFTGLSIRENIAARILRPLSRGGVISTSREHERARQAADSFRVKAPQLETDISALSGGNQQKAVLAGAVAAEPQVLLLDEPSQGVDVGARSEIYALIRQRAAETGMAVIVVSSDAKELEGLCDRVSVFSRGQIVTELDGGEVTEESITDAALNATSERAKLIVRRNRLSQWLAGDSAPIALVAGLLVVLGVVAQAVNPHFLGAASMTTLLLMSTTLIFAALAQNLVLLIGGIDLSVGPYMGLIVVVLSFFLIDGTPPGLQALGWVLLIVFPVILGTTNWTLSDIGRIHPMIATLVTYMALQAIALILRPVPGGTISNGVLEPLSARIGPVPIMFLAAVFVALALTWWVLRSPSGIAVRGTGSNPSIAEVNGLRPGLIRLLVYIGASLLATLGALTLMVQLGSGDPTAGTSYTLSSISAAVIGGASLLGGRGTFLGAFFAALLIQTAMSVTTFLGLSSAWQQFLLGGLTIAAVAGYSRSRQFAKVEAR